MNRKNIRQLKAKLSKEDKQFKEWLCTYVFNNSVLETDKILNSISSDIAIINKINKYWLPKSIESLCSHQCLCIPKNIESTLSWVVFMINLFKEKIELYIEQKHEYERYLFSKNYKKAYEVLQYIEKEICVSLWSSQQIFLLKEYLGGLKANKKKLEEYSKCSAKNGLLQIIINYYSKQAEINVSYENYQESVKNYIKRFSKDNIINNYFNYKINLDCEIEFENMVIPLQIDSQISIIDLYETTIDILQQIYASENDKINLYEIIKKISIETDYRINNIMHIYKVSKHIFDLSQNEFNQILELYTIGEYSQTKLLLEKYLNNYTEDFQAHTLWVKCLIKLQEPINSDMQLLNDFYNIYVLNEKYNESYLDIALYYKLINGTSWKYKLRGMLDRKRNIVDSKKYKKLTYLNDMHITPSYVFNMCNKEMCIMWLNRLHEYCPSASDLFLHIYKGVSLDKSIKDDFRKSFYEAIRLFEHKNYNEAVDILEPLLTKQNDNDLYHIEKVSRKLFFAYAAQKELRKILFLTIDLFFKNNYLIKKFDFAMIKKEIFEINITTIKADIRYPIFIYIIDKNNKNQQRIAYSNYMDYNQLSNINDIIKKEKTQSKWLNFFLYNICITDIIKKDFRVIITGANVDDIRISVLRYLMKADKKMEKVYFNEITDIMTRKNIRNNIKQINHSRIFVDTVNIKKVYYKLFNEEFNKYIIVKNFEKDIRTLDINDKKSSLTFIKRVSEITTKRKNDVKYNQEYIVIKNLSEKVLEQLLYNTQYGLDTFLSSRIRHGFCKSTIKAAFEECHLLSQKRSETDLTYNINKYWEEKLGSNSTLFSEVNSILSYFTNVIEKKIDEVKNSWIKIRYKEATEGFFDYTSFIATFLTVFERLKLSDFDNYYNAIVEVFEKITNNILESLRTKIKTELYSFFIEQLKILEQKIIDLNTQETSGIINSINQCKSKISNSMSEFAEIFYLEKNTYDDFSCKDVVETCIEINKNINSSFNSVKIEKKVNDNFILKGSYFPFFVDMINQVINNAIEHSKLSMRHLKLKIKIEAGINDNILRNKIEAGICDDVLKIYKFKDFEFDEKASYLNIHLINNMSSRLDPTTVKSKLEKIFTKFNNPDILRKYSQTEGGSGLYKLYTTLQYHIGEKYIIYYSINEENFELGIIIEVNNLIVDGR